MAGTSRDSCTVPKPFDQPYEKRWELLKDVIVGRFLGLDGTHKPMKIPELAQFMKETYSFVA